MTSTISLPKIFFTLLFLASFGIGKSQVVADKFGQNRIQLEQKKWFRYLSPNFAISYTQDDEPLARFVLSVIEEDYIQLGELFEHQLKNRIEVFVYGDYSDYAQSNIGTEDHIINKGGVTDIITPKIEVYFDGNHHHLRKQIKEGLSKVLLGKIMAGTNIQEIVQNSVLMNIPNWFVLGAIDYASESWTTTKDNQLRDVLLQGKYANFLEFADHQPRLAGHSLFHFIKEHHGPTTISNLLYLTRVNRSIDNGFLYAFGKTFYQIAGTDWYNYYSDRYNADNYQRRFPSKGEIPAKIARKAKVKNVKISPNTKNLVWIEQKEGVQKVMLYNIAKKEKTTIYKFGKKDYTNHYEKNYPLVQWANNQQLIVIYEKKAKVKIQYYNVTTQTKKTAKTIPNLDRITSFTVQNTNDLILVGLREGQSDLYHYNKGKLKAITNDYWDEKEAIFATIKGQKGIIFSSNRPRPILKNTLIGQKLALPNFDLFFYSLETQSPQLILLTRSSLSDETHLLALPNNQFSYLGDANGFANRYIAQIDTILLRYERVLWLNDGTKTIVSPDSFISNLAVDSSILQPVYLETSVAYANTDYSRNILEQDSKGNKIVDLFYKNGQYHIFVRTIRPERKMPNIAKTSFRKLIENREIYYLPEDNVNPPATKDSLTTPTKDTSKVVDIDNYEFQSEFDDVEEPKLDEEGKTLSLPRKLIEKEGDLLLQEQAQKKVLSEIVQTKKIEWESKYTRPYQGLFKLNQLTIQFDNTPMYNNTDLYLNNYYNFQPLSLLGKLRFEDIYENFTIQLGIRVPLSFNSIEYFIDIENKKELIDQRYSFYRRSRTEYYEITDTINNITINAQGQNIKHIIESEFKYPLSKTQSIRGIFGLQLERIAILAEDLLSLQVPIQDRNQIHARFEYVFDNSIGLRLNVRKGLRFKAYVDFYKPFSVQTLPTLNVDWSRGLTTALGFDGRYYHTFDNKSVFAFRLAGAASMGQQKILYSLGGVENWIFTSEEKSIALPSAQKFSLQTLAASLRGFGSNARNGSSYFAGNFELRIPIVSYLSRNTPRNAMLRNLQVIGFIDVGTAWQGLSPFSDDNPLNTTVISNNNNNAVSPVKVIVNYYRRPILFSYGIGIRTVLLGHYFKLDYAWGVETGQTQTPMLHLSIGTDF